jgi:hypothetical protein
VLLALVVEVVDRPTTIVTVEPLGLEVPLFGS